MSLLLPSVFIPLILNQDTSEIEKPNALYSVGNANLPGKNLIPGVWIGTDHYESLPAEKRNYTVPSVEQECDGASGTAGGLQ